MAEYYKFEIANWNEGTANLTLEQEAAYLRVVSIIRLYGQQIRPNMRVLAGLWRCNERKAKRIFAELIALQKLYLQDGLIFTEYDRNATEDMGREYIPAHIRADVFAEGSCAYCSTDAGPFEIDHMHPWSRGGSNSRDNLTLACRPCNRSKGARTINEWMAIQ